MHAAKVRLLSAANGNRLDLPTDATPSDCGDEIPIKD